MPRPPEEVDRKLDEIDRALGRLGKAMQKHRIIGQQKSDPERKDKRRIDPRVEVVRVRGKSVRRLKR